MFRRLCCGITTIGIAATAFASCTGSQDAADETATGTEALSANGANAARSPATSVPALKDWRRAMSKTPLPKAGCFQAKHPNTTWEEVPCGPPSSVSLVVGKGGEGQAGVETVGGLNGPSETATAPGTGGITWAEGSFPMVAGVTSSSPSSYSLQINSNRFSGVPLCVGAQKGGGVTPHCQGAEQFVYQAEGTLMIEYWLMYYGNTQGIPGCPSGWAANTDPQTGMENCYLNTRVISAPVVPAANLSNVALFAQAASSANGGDSVLLSYQGTLYALSTGNNLLNLYEGWNTVEFNAFGAGNGAEYSFNAGSSLVAQILTNSPTTSPVACNPNGGVTMETNNLNLINCSAYNNDGVPGIQFFETNGTMTQKLPVPGPMTDGIFRPGTSRGAQAQWFLSTLNVENFTDIGPYDYGYAYVGGNTANDIPIVGDWTGQGYFTDGIFRPANSVFNNSGTGQALWYLSNSNTANNTNFGPYTWGSPGDIPVVGNWWTSNGTYTMGLFRPANSPYNTSNTGQAEWFFATTNGSDPTFDGPYYWGSTGDVPVVGDWDGTGTLKMGLFRPASTGANTSNHNQWFLAKSIGTDPAYYGPYYYGDAQDLPVVGDWDGNGTWTMGIFRPANTLNNSTSQAQWFLSNINKSNWTDIGPYSVRQR